MPNGYRSFDELYKGVAENKPGLTPEQFKQDMSNPDKRFKLWKNLKDNKDSQTPQDYGEFVDYYGFGKKESPKPVAQGSDYEKISSDLSNAMLSTGYWKQTNNGFEPKDPAVNAYFQQQKGADDYFESYLNQNERQALPYVNAYYNSKTQQERDSALNKIKSIDENWKPLPFAQWKQVQDAKVNMYLQDKLGQSKQDSLSHNFLSKPVDQITPEEKEAYEKYGQLNEARTKNAAAFAQLAYLGKDVTSENPDVKNWFTRLLDIAGRDIGKFATEGIYNPDTEAEWNQRISNILTKNGINLQTKEQAEASTPSAGQVTADALGQGVGFILPMLAGSWSGNAMRIPEITSALSKNSNKILAFGGKVLGKSLENAVILQIANWNQSFLNTGEQAGLFTVGDMLLNRLGLRAISPLGKALMGAFRGSITGAGMTIAPQAFDATVDAIKNDDSFIKEFGKHSPGTQGYIANIISMGLLGTLGGVDDPKIKDEAQKEIRTIDPVLNDNLNEVRDNVTQGQAKAQNAASEFLKTPMNTRPAPHPVQEMHPITIDDDKRAYVIHGAENIDQNKPSTNKAYIKDFGTSDEANKEIQQEKRDAVKKGLVAKTIELKNKDGTVIGTRVIVTDMKHEHLGSRLYELSIKELTGTITPDETHELTGLTNGDVVKSLEGMKNNAKNEGVKSDYENIINHIKENTEQGNGAKNKVVDLLQKSDEFEKEGNKNEAFKYQKLAEIEAKKYGFKTHWNNRGELEIVDGNEKVGEKSVKSENAQSLIDAVKNGDAETAKLIADKENLDVTKKTGDKGEVVEVKDGQKPLLKTDYHTIDQEEDYDNLLQLVNNIGKTGDRETVRIQGMDDNEVAKGVQDIIKGNPSVEHEQVLEYLKKNQNIITDKREYTKDDFNSVYDKEKHKAESLFNRKYDTGIRVNSKDVSFAELKKKGEQPKVDDKKVKEYTDILSKMTPEHEAIGGDEKAWRIGGIYYSEYNKRQMEKYVSGERKDINNNIVSPKKKVDYTSETPVVPSEGMSEDDVNKLIAEKSVSPSEILRTYIQESEKVKDLKENDRSKFIEDSIGKEGIDQKSYQRFGDRNKVTATMAKKFFKKGGEKIDTIAKNASYALNPEGQGTDISPQDVVDYMEDKTESARTPLMKELENRFKEVTGQPLYKPFKGASEQIDEYKKQLKEQEEQLKKYHNDYENYVSQLGEDELRNEEEQIFGGEEKGFSGEVQKPDEGGKGKTPPTDNITAAGFTGKDLKGLFGSKTSILNSLGINSKVNIEDLPQRSQDIARGFNNTKGEFIELYNKNKPEDLKSSLADKAIEYKKKPFKTEGEKIENEFTSSVLDNMSAAINSQSDADNIAKIFKGFNKFVYDGKEYYANNLKEIEKLKDFRRPQAPMKKSELMALKNNIFSNLDKLMDAQEAQSEKQLALGKRDFSINRSVNRAAFYMQWLHTQSPPEIREKTQSFIKNIQEPLTKVVHANKVKNSGMRLAIEDNLKGTDDKKIYTALITGDHQGKQWTTEELQNQGLSDKEIASYHSIRDWIDKNGHDQFKEAYKYYRGYWDMKPEEQKEYLKNWNDYVDKNAGHVPLQRGKGDWAISAWGKNPVTGEEGRYFSRHESEKEAKQKAKELEKKGFIGVTDERGEKGMGGGAKGEKPRVYYVAPKEQIASEQLRSINDFEQALERSGLPEKDRNKLTELINDNSLFLSAEDRNTVNKILERNDYAKGLTDQVIDNMNRFKKNQSNPHFLRRSTDINGNVVQGYPEDLKGILDNIEDFNNRATHNLGRAMFEYRFNKGVKDFKGARYREVYNDLNSLHDYVKQGTVESMNGFKNVIYFADMAAKPVQIIRNLMHTFNTVLPDAGNEIDKINIERKQKGLPEFKNWAYVMGAQAIKRQVIITSHVIGGSPLPESIPKTLRDGIEFISSRGGLEHQFTNYINGNEAVGKKWQVRAAFTGFTDVATRVHAAVMAHELGLQKGLSGTELNKYIEDFVDRNKFEWGRYNVPQFQRMFKASGGGLKVTAQIASNIIKAPFMLKGFMFQDLGWNQDYLQRAENKTQAIGRIAIPRLIVSGGILKTIAAFGGVGVAGLEGIYEAIWGHKNDEDMRGQAVKLLGKDMGNDLADNITYGMMSKLTGTNLQSMMDAGNYIGDSFPLADQIGGAGQGFFKDMGNVLNDGWNGDYRQMLKDLPVIQFQNIRKGFLYYNMMKENRPAYTGGGSRIIPTGTDVAKKFMGFTPLDWSNYYMGQGFKQDLVGKTGSMREPDPKSKAGVIQNMIREQVEQGDTSKVMEYDRNPTDSNFVKAFGGSLYKNVQKYNDELFNNYYIARQSMNAHDFKDSLTMLNNVREMAIGISNQDKQWMGESPSNVFILKAIEKTLQYQNK